jgi:hypothetical protein
MKNNYLRSALLLGMSLLAAKGAEAQNPVVSKWEFNSGGQHAAYQYYPNFPNTSTTSTQTMSDSAGIFKVCYNTTYAYVQTDGLPNFTMGPWSNPNVPAAQNNIFKIPLNPSQQTGTQTAVPTGGYIALAVDGTAIYGNRSADSYNTSTGTNSGMGNNVWHCDAWVNEGSTMDASGNGHNDASGNYHYHANPSTLYSTAGTSHSPILGFALDGYPIYGPFGYVSAMNSGSGVTRMTSSYQLRNITTRTTLPNGTTASSAGPAVSATFPLGTYVEDYEYISGLGELDELNGRYCVTPEYPSGTYAYFISTDNSGQPAYPYILATYYYGVVSSSDIGPNAGNSSFPTGPNVTCVTSTPVGLVTQNGNGPDIAVYPNPGTGIFHLEVSDAAEYSVFNALGQELMHGKAEAGKQVIDLSGAEQGIYFVKVHMNDQVQTLRVVKQ